MKNSNINLNPAPANGSQGFTLVELMITLALSLLITYAIAQVLISSNQTSVTSDGMSQSQETGRFVMSYLSDYIREAGMDTLDGSKETQAVISCDEFPGLIGTSGNLACSSESVLGDTQLTINSLGIHGDRLAIATIPAGPASDIQDCTGTGGFTADDIVLNVFWVESKDVNGPNNLMCQGHMFDGSTIRGSNPAQEIANGVESMHVLYGEGIVPIDESVSTDRNVGRYVNGNQVDNWDQVYAIKVSVLTRSIINVTNINSSKGYILLDAAPYLMTDAVSRQVFTSTFTFNNHW